MANKQQSSCIVHNHYACTVGAAYTVAAIKGAVPIANCGPGCMYKQFFFLSFDNGFQGTSGVSGGNIPSANVGKHFCLYVRSQFCICGKIGVIRAVG